MSARDEIARKVANALLDIGAVGITPNQPVVFKAGLISPVYIDNRSLISHPNQWHTVIEAFRAVTEELGIAYTIIAGIAEAGIPHMSALAYSFNKPGVWIRKDAIKNQAGKDHGLGKSIEGGHVDGQHALLVEDHITTLSSAEAGVELLRQAGATVTDILAITSYSFPEASAEAIALEIVIHTLTTFSIILEEAVKRNLITIDEMTSVIDWLNDAVGWAVKRGWENQSGKAVRVLTE